MTPEQLKSSILYCAIQGKLVEQRQEEGTAEELYKQIEEEKQKHIKEGKKKKEKSFSEITENEIPFDIPDSWKWVHLNDIAISGLGKTLNKSTDVGEEVPYLCSINVYWEGISLDKVKTAKFDTQSKEKYRLQKGDLLICEGGEAGRSAIWDSDEEMYYQNALHRVRFYGSINAPFFCYVLECYKKNGTIANYTKGIGIQHLVQASLNSIWLPLPPIEEQHRIVAKIEELLPYVDRYAEAYEKLEQFNTKFPEDMKKSILQYAIQGKLVEQRPEEGTAEELYQQIQEEKKKLIKDGKIKKERPLAEIAEDEIPFDIPESWKWVRLPEIGELSRGKSKHRPRNDAILYDGGGWPFIQTGDVAQTNYHIKTWNTEYNKMGLEQSRLWPKGTLCLTIAANIGNVAILDFDACFPDSVVGFNAFHPIISNEFFLYGLMCYKTILDKMSHSTAQKNINIDILSKVAFPLPPLEEQHRIVAKIEKLLPYCERLAE